jgi:hypothetical protein
MHREYSSAELKDINAQNSKRLPPANAVHGMAVYELKRDAEEERLFHSVLFDLDQLKQTKATQQARTESLEQTVKACASHHDNERPVSLASGKHVMNHQVSCAKLIFTCSEINSASPELIHSLRR